MGQQDKRAAISLATAGTVVAGAALGLAWLALPSLFTERQLASAGILALFVLLVTYGASFLIPRTLSRLGVPLSPYAYAEAATLMFAVTIIGTVAGIVFGNTSVGVLIGLACMGPRLYLKSLRPTPATARR